MEGFYFAFAPICVLLLLLRVYHVVLVVDATGVVRALHAHLPQRPVLRLRGEVQHRRHVRRVRLDSHWGAAHQLPLLHRQYISPITNHGIRFEQCTIEWTSISTLLTVLSQFKQYIMYSLLSTVGSTDTVYFISLRGMSRFYLGSYIDSQRLQPGRMQGDTALQGCIQISIHKQDELNCRRQQQLLVHMNERNNRGKNGKRAYESYEVELIDPVQDAKKWWDQLQEKYFRPLLRKQYVDCRDLTTSDRMISELAREAECLMPCFRSQLTTDYPPLSEASLLHILYRIDGTRLLASYLMQKTTAPDPQPQPLHGYKITPSSPNLLQHQTKSLRLTLVHWTDNQDVCRNAEVVKKGLLNNIDEEIQAWAQELARVNKCNTIAWNSLVQQIRTQKTKTREEETSEIRRKLMWGTMLKYFQQGYADKTHEMVSANWSKAIKGPKADKTHEKVSANQSKAIKGSKESSLFETDCKICFCSLNADSNQVLYCDQCNTSFHLACYGLREVPPEQVYYCQCCARMRADQKSKNISIKKILCQLCCKKSFPLKQINNHFYHVTCLMLFNLLQVSEEGLALRHPYTHTQIVQLIIKSQLQQQPCAFCASNPHSGSQFGIRLKCQLCSAAMHPICAYIHGCEFQVRRNSQRTHLNVILRCNAHNAHRDAVEQTYLRRYMCDFNSTSTLSLSQFRVIYAKELQDTIPPLQQYCTVQRVLAKTKIITKHLQSQPKYESAPTESRKMLNSINKLKCS